MKRLAVVLLLPAITLAVVLGVRALGGGHAAARSGQVGGGSAAAQATTACPFESSLIGRVIVPAVPARIAPDPQARVVAWFHRTNAQGSPQVFLVESAAANGWVRAASREPGCWSRWSMRMTGKCRPARSARS